MRAKKVDRVSEANLHDVLPYYIGCQFVFTYNDGETVIGTLDGFRKDGWLCGDGWWVNADEIDWYEIDDIRTEGRMRLILTHPQDVSDELYGAYKDLCYRCKDSNKTLLRVVDTPDSLHFMLRNHVDGFDLIERGLAIDKNDNPYERHKVYDPTF